jgi:DNA modification methylase
MIDLFGKEVSKKPSLSNKFIVSPFSVLDARQGPWQKRKRQWLRIGIQSELGRGEDIVTDMPNGTKKVEDTLKSHLGRKENLLGMSKSNAEFMYNQKEYFKKLNKVSPGGSPRPACDYKNKERGDGSGKPLAKAKINGLTFKGEGFAAEIFAERGGGTSVFDPVLCELMYRWFCPNGGKIFDPFAGGSVRGIVASCLGFKYTGMDLSKAQIQANEEQAEKIIPSLKPNWIVGDSLTCKKVAKDDYDFVFSCPPYADLERYSEDPKDLSTMSYDDFVLAYSKIISRSVSMLKDNRFACFVVGEVRDKKTGFYRNFVGDTIQAFVNAGAYYYNEIILVTAIGSLPIRVGKQFQSGRKIGKTHQNILVFYKGDPKEIKSLFPNELVTSFVQQENK